MPVLVERLTLTNASPELSSTVLFQAGGLPYTVADAIASAMFRGTLDEAIDETLALAAAEERAEAGGVEIDDDALQTSFDEFRYEHDLISAGETEEWLKARGMTTDDLGRWVYQRLARDAAAAAELTAAPPDFADRLCIHLWLSGEMNEIAKQLSRRIASDLEMKRREETPAAPVAMQRFLERHRLDEQSLDPWLAAIGRDRAWLTETARIEGAFDRMMSLVTTGESRARKLASMQLSLAKIDIETLELDSEAAAREAFLCVRDDGASLADVARDAGYHATRAEVWIETLDDNLGQRLLGAAEGQAIGPIESNRRFKVVQLLGKRKPSLDDPAVAERVDEALADEFFDDLCARHIDAGDLAHWQ